MITINMLTQNKKLSDFEDVIEILIKFMNIYLANLS